MNLTLEERLAHLIDAAKYAVNRLDSMNEQVQVAGDLAVALATVMTEEQYHNWKSERAKGGLT